MAKTRTDQTGRRVNYATYPYDYFTGSQVRVFFGGIWVDDIATIEYQSNHTKTPLYGYNDHQFRAIAKGQFIVNGRFSIAFKETGYLNIIMGLIKQDNAGLNRILQSDDTKKMRKFVNALKRGITPEQALDNAFSGSEVAEIARTRQNGSTRDFEDIAEVLEDAIWGDPKTPARFSDRIPRVDELDYFHYSKNQDQNFDIDLAGFDIVLSFGDFRRNEAEHTIIGLNDVHITGEAMVITPDGEPIGMQYNFFSRGLNERISSQESRLKDSNVKLDQGTGGTNNDKDPTREDIEDLITQVRKIEIIGQSLGNRSFVEGEGAPIFPDQLGGVSADIPFQPNSILFNRPVALILRNITGIVNVPVGFEKGSIPKSSVGQVMQEIFRTPSLLDLFLKKVDTSVSPSVGSSDLPIRNSAKFDITVILDDGRSGSREYTVSSHGSTAEDRVFIVIDKTVETVEANATAVSDITKQDADQPEVLGTGDATLIVPVDAIGPDRVLDLNASGVVRTREETLQELYNKELSDLPVFPGIKIDANNVSANEANILEPDQGVSINEANQISSQSSQSTPIPDDPTDVTKQDNATPDPIPVGEDIPVSEFSDAHKENLAALGLGDLDKDTKQDKSADEDVAEQAPEPITGTDSSAIPDPERDSIKQTGADDVTVEDTGIDPKQDGSDTPTVEDTSRDLKQSGTESEIISEGTDIDAKQGSSSDADVPESREASDLTPPPAEFVVDEQAEIKLGAPDEQDREFELEETSGAGDEPTDTKSDKQDTPVVDDSVPNQNKLTNKIIKEEEPVQETQPIVQTTDSFVQSLVDQLESSGEAGLVVEGTGSVKVTSSDITIRDITIGNGDTQTPTELAKTIKILSGADAAEVLELGIENTTKEFSKIIVPAAVLAAEEAIEQFKVAVAEGGFGEAILTDKNKFLGALTQLPLIGEKIESFAEKKILEALDEILSTIPEVSNPQNVLITPTVELTPEALITIQEGGKIDAGAVIKFISKSGQAVTIRLSGLQIQVNEQDNVIVYTDKATGIATIITKAGEEVQISFTVGP